MINKFTVTESVNSIDMTLGPFLTLDTANQARRYLMALEKLSTVDAKKIESIAKKEKLHTEKSIIKKAKQDKWAITQKVRADKKLIQEKITADKKYKKEQNKINRENIQKEKDERWAFILEERADKKEAKEKIAQEKLDIKYAKENKLAESAEKRKAFHKKNGLHY